MKGKNPSVELLPSPAELARAPVERAELERMVKEQVAQVMAARDAFIFEPFFRSRKIAYELKRIQTVDEQRKFRVYYERYGCMICETREHIHVGNGMCGRCYNRTFTRLTQIVAEMVMGRPAAPGSQRYAEATEPARGLLPAGGGTHRWWNKPRRGRNKPLDWKPRAEERNEE